MSDVHNHLEHYFQPLIGTEQAERELRQRIGIAVVTAMAESPQIDPFVALNRAWCLESERIIKHMRTPDMTLDDDGMLGQIAENGVIGPPFMSIILRTVGHIYRKDATLPQHRSTVEQSVDNVTHHAHRLAFCEREMANHAKFALLAGVQMDDPRLNRLARLQVETGREIIGNPVFMRNAYNTLTSHDGQLTVMPNVMLPPRDPNQVCPAAAIHVARPEHMQTALLTTMRLFGTVAIEHIYPTQFPMD